MKIKVGDTIVFKNDSRLYCRKRAEYPRLVTGIQKCKDKDKLCPNKCPGLIQIDNVSKFDCYAIMDLEDKFIMSISKVDKSYKPKNRNGGEEFSL